MLRESPRVADADPLAVAGREVSVDRVVARRIRGDVELTLAEEDVVGDLALLVHRQHHGRLVADAELLVDHGILVGVFPRRNQGLRGGGAGRPVAVEVDHPSGTLCHAVLEGAVREHEVVVGGIGAVLVAVVDAHARGGLHRALLLGEELLLVAHRRAVGSDGKGVDRIGGGGLQPFGPQIRIHTLGEACADSAQQVVGHLRRTALYRQVVGFGGVFHGDRVDGIAAVGLRQLDRDGRCFRRVIRFILLAGEERHRTCDKGGKKGPV